MYLIKLKRPILKAYRCVYHAAWLPLMQNVEMPEHIADVLLRSDPGNPGTCVQDSSGGGGNGWRPAGTHLSGTFLCSV